jgi:glutathione S-transferase
MHTKILILAAALLFVPAVTGGAHAQPAQSQNAPAQERPRRELPPHLFMLWKKEHPGERFGDVWNAMSQSDQQKLRNDLQEKWDALTTSERNALQQQARDQRQQRRARRQARRGNDNAGNAGAANQVDSAPSESTPPGETAMTAVPVTLVTAIVTLLALLFYFWTGWQVGVMRGKHSIKAPAMTGHLEFESAVRVQMNTLEWMVIFLPLLWLATIYFSPAMSIAWLSWLPPVVGVIWIIGRLLYMTGYMQAPEKRGTGFGIAGIAVIALFIMAVIGVVMQWMAANAA